MNRDTAWKIQLAAKPAHRPPMVWERIAFPVILLQPRLDIMAT